MNKPLRVAVMGDICMDQMQDAMTPERAAALLAGVRPLLDAADLRIANLENAIAEPDAPIAKCGPNLWQKPENLCFYREARVDCAILANNHTGDFGPEGVENTVRVLDEWGLGNAGAGANLDAAYEPWYALTDAGIPFFRHGTLGSGVTVSIGDMAERFRYFVNASDYEKAAETIPSEAGDMSDEELERYIASYEESPERSGEEEKIG